MELATRCRIAALSIAVSSGCGAAEPRTSELTAGQHETEAAREEQAAERSDERYDPDAQEYVGAHVATSPMALGMEPYNPTQPHLREAREHREHAAAHRARAAELRAFEERECRGLSASEREACPLLLGVARIEDIEGGVRLTFASDTDLAPVVQQIRCHLAFAAARGRDGMDECALYVHGAHIGVRGNVIELTTPDEERVAELRVRARVQAP